jgi:hypothetical protein
MYKLGYTVDAGSITVPTDAHVGAITGLRVNLRNAQSIIFLVTGMAAASGTDDVVLTFKEHTASSSGTTTNLNAGANTNGVTTWWLKAATTLAGTETWAKQTQAAGATVTIPGAANAAKQFAVAVQLNTKDIDDGYDYVSCSVGALATASRFISVNPLLTDLVTKRDPANLAATLF